MKVHPDFDHWFDAGASMHEAWGPPPTDIPGLLLVLHPAAIKQKRWEYVRYVIAGLAADGGVEQLHVTKLDSQWIIVTEEPYNGRTDQWFGVVSRDAEWSFLGAS